MHRAVVNFLCACVFQMQSKLITFTSEQNLHLHDKFLYYATTKPRS